MAMTGTVVGALIAFIAYCLVVISAPMLLDRESDVFIATVTSCTGRSQKPGSDDPLGRADRRTDSHRPGDGLYRPDHRLSMGRACDLARVSQPCRQLNELNWRA